MASTAHGAQSRAPVGRILVIDDEQRIVNFVRRGLEAEGLTVDVALEARMASVSVEHPYDLVILDLVMPGLGGPTSSGGC